ncbi:hypothetical protein [Goodfellowiella coeruleoviolacea]|uniref:Gram-positive cocci surface proteins LPxTG domain-containing protein n=1 Tax=Goodfellowiella coeruleoviolacea TaxID=334858 RepID=A0AAE3KKH7_9PSEU|nr:hypothetical protein [Goodfellowiella coeruleoviolacea]MCP2165443.1 hypothetical protein [Goodfellowiella coeruleoviolacea]
MAIRTRALLLGLFGLLVTAFAAAPAGAATPSAADVVLAAQLPAHHQQQNTDTPAPAGPDLTDQNQQQPAPAEERTGPAWMGALGLALIAAVIYGGQVVRKKRAGK